MRSARVRVLVEIALTIALAAVLNTLRIWRMPNAGTVSLVMLPIIVLGLRRGLRIALAAGALYGLVDFFVDPFPPLHWAQFVLDYPVAYAAVGLAGVFALAWHSACDRGQVTRALWRVVLPAAIIASAARYGVHVLSGYIFFGEYAPPGQPVLVYSLLYNLYVPISGALCFIAALLVMPALERSSHAEAPR
jgi:thiamine transporter